MDQILNINFRGTSHSFEFDDTSTIQDLISNIYSKTGIPADYIKLIVPSIGLIKGSDKKPNDKISDIFNTPASRSKITLVGSAPDQINQLCTAEHIKELEHQRLVEKYRQQKKHQRKPRRSPIDSEDLQYTFDKLVPLAVLPHQDESLKILQRLKDDRGIQAIMRKYKLKVGILTELDPASNTSHDCRRLGLNEGKGQVIRLRIRTDNYEGWCSYKEVRKVLCHELTHNYYGDHDRQFWDMCNKLEKEVVELDPYGRDGKLTGPEVYDGPSSSWTEPEEGQDKETHIREIEMEQIISLRNKILEATERRMREENERKAKSSSNSEEKGKEKSR